MATARELGLGVGNFYRKKLPGMVETANEYVGPISNLKRLGSAAVSAGQFGAGIASGVAGEEVPATPPPSFGTAAPGAAPSMAAKPATQAQAPIIGSGLDKLPTMNYGVKKSQQGPISSFSSSYAGNAETVGMNPPGLGVRKITGANGSTTYTNDPQQADGVPLGVGGARGTLSVIGDPRTEGMNQAQAVAYWQNQSDQIDARAATREQERIAASSIAQPGDSIGEMLAKRANRSSSQNLLQLGVRRQQVAQSQGGDFIPKVQGADEQAITALNRQGLELGVKGKQAELKLAEQVNALQEQYLNETDPAKQRVLASKINALTGQDQQKFQVVTEKGVADDGITPTQNAYLVDAAGNVKPVSGGAAQITPQQAHAEAAKAIATGRISKDEANKRLASAGFPPII